LHQYAAHVLGKVEVVAVADGDLHPQVLGPGLHHGNGLRVAAGIHHEHVLVVLGLSVRREGEINNDISNKHT